MIRKVFNLLYKKSRGINLENSEAIPFQVIFRYSLTKMIQLLRGFLKGYRYVFLGKRVSVTGRKYLQVKSNVVIGDYVEIVAYSKSGVILGSRVTLDKGVVLRATSVIRQIGVGIMIGNRTAIGANSFLNGVGGIEIGEDCLLGPSVKIFSGNHEKPTTDSRSIEKRDIPSKIVIGDNVWIGANTLILAGVEIGSNSVIGAGSVVNKNVPTNGTVAGVPIKNISK